MVGKLKVQRMPTMGSRETLNENLVTQNIFAPDGLLDESARS